MSPWWIFLMARVDKEEANRELVALSHRATVTHGHPLCTVHCAADRDFNIRHCNGPAHDCIFLCMMRLLSYVEGNERDINIYR